MICIQNYRGQYSYVSPDAVASITEAGTNSKWHGIHSFVTLFDGLIESCEDAELIARRVVDAKRGV